VVEFELAVTKAHSTATTAGEVVYRPERLGINMRALVLIRVVMLNRHYRHVMAQATNGITN
jgi:hypothetical protein